MDLELEIEHLLHNRFKINSLYPYQKLVIHSILEKGLLKQSNYYKEQLIIFPTGSGKSLCFMLPSMLFENLTVAVYPLLSLMHDQQRRLEKLNWPCEVLKGGLSKKEKESLFNNLKSKKTKFLITNVESLNNEEVINTLKEIPISMFVVDEAHTVTQWGESFRPAYLLLKSIISQLNIDQVVAFTATASPKVITKINELLFPLGKAHTVYANPDRTNIYYQVIPTLCKLHDLVNLIGDENKLPMVVFCNSRDKCSYVASKLQQRLMNIKIDYYHAKLEKEEKQRVEKWFFNETKGVLVATKAYGLGVDKQNIRCVVHYDLPTDIESFLQESGRGARDHNLALSITLLSPYSGKNSDPKFVEVIKNNSNCKREALLDLLGFKIDQCSGCDVCDETTIKIPDGFNEIYKLIYFNPFKYNLSSCARCLKGIKENSEDYYNPYFGTLNRWNLLDIESSIRALLYKKVIYLSFNKKLYVNYFKKLIC
ncbi:MAG: RecQ family ATP-dependent DNA helicase [Sphaerochaetaceae bacterium]